MFSSNLSDHRSIDRREVDGRWSGAGGEVLVAVKRTSNARDIRGALLSLAYRLAEDPALTSALCVLTQSKLSRSRTEHEAERFRWLVRPDVAQRVHLASMQDIIEGRSDQPFLREPGFLQWLEALVARETSGARANRQTVKSAIALSWLRGAGPMTGKALQDLCGASYPTVAAAIEEFADLGLVEQRSDRRVFLRYLPLEQWIQMARKHADGRKIHRFVDPTGLARPPEAMANKLFKLQEEQGLGRDIAVGGVLGARRYFPDLDITATPRLDLSVYGDGPLDFVRRLDAALEPTTDPRAKPTLVVHRTTEPASFIDHHGGGAWASELECGADLIEIGLLSEAREMLNALNHRRSLTQNSSHP